MDNIDPRPVYRTTATPKFEMPASGYMCIAFAFYLLLVGLFVMVRQILKRKGFCHELCQTFEHHPTAQSGVKCCECCIDFNETFPCTEFVYCCKSSPHKKKNKALLTYLAELGCCSGTGNAEICDVKTWRCDQYCHYLRCMGCIIRFNEPYTLWSADVEYLNTMEAMGKSEPQTTQPLAYGAIAEKETYLEWCRKKVMEDSSHTASLNQRIANGQKFNANYGPGLVMDNTDEKNMAKQQDHTANMFIANPLGYQHQIMRNYSPNIESYKLYSDQENDRIFSPIQQTDGAGIGHLAAQTQRGDECFDAYRSPTSNNHGNVLHSARGSTSLDPQYYQNVLPDSRRVTSLDIPYRSHIMGIPNASSVPHSIYQATYPQIGHQSSALNPSLSMKKRMMYSQSMYNALNLDTRRYKHVRETQGSNSQPLGLGRGNEKTLHSHNRWPHQITPTTLSPIESLASLQYNTQLI